MGSSLYHSESRGNGGGGHSPVGGESLLVAQAGGGSCTRSGELKLRRKEEDCGKRGQREGMGMSQPAEYLALPKPQDPLTWGTSLKGTHSPTCQSWEPSASRLCMVPYSPS